MVGGQFFFALVEAFDNYIVLLEEMFGFGEQKLGVLVCGFEIEGVLGRITLSLLGSGPTEDVSEQGADIVVEP